MLRNCKCMMKRVPASEWINNIQIAGKFAVTRCYTGKLKIVLLQVMTMTLMHGLFPQCTPLHLAKYFSNYILVCGGSVVVAHRSASHTTLTHKI